MRIARHGAPRHLCEITNLDIARSNARAHIIISYFAVCPLPYFTYTISMLLSETGVLQMNFEFETHFTRARNSVLSFERPNETVFLLNSVVAFHLNIFNNNNRTRKTGSDHSERRRLLPNILILLFFTMYVKRNIARYQTCNAVNFKY